MNKILVEKNSDKEIYLTDEENSCYILEENAHLKVYHFMIDKSSDVEIYLKGENAKVEYYFSTINKNNNHFNIKIHHEESNTESNVVNHGVNTENNKLNIIVDGIIPKQSSNCLCNQDNKIINLKDGKSSIKPNLLIDNYDSIANHAAYIGNFKENILFYLNSRGISNEVATKMLIKGFLIHDNVKLELIKEFLEQIDNL